MTEQTGVEWADHTHNFWIGCTKVSPACKNCYAERDMDLRYGKVTWGPDGTRVMKAAGGWGEPFKWNRGARVCQCEDTSAEAFTTCGKRLTKEARDPSVGKGTFWKCPVHGEVSSPSEIGFNPDIKQRIFTCSLADFFEDWRGPITLLDGSQMFRQQTITPARVALRGDLVASRAMTMQDLREMAYKTFDATPNLEWLVLTKRPENIERMWDGKKRPNVRFGTSVENQHYAEERLDQIITAGDKFGCGNFVSAEPLVGPVELSRWIKGLDWVITGGESGPEARPAEPDWFRLLRNVCEKHDVPFLFKQWGEWGPEHLHQRTVETSLTHNPSEQNEAIAKFSERQVRWGKKKAGRELDGVVHDGFPQ